MEGRKRLVPVRGED
jgi:hypothetical protein